MIGTGYDLTCKFPGKGRGYTEEFMKTALMITIVSALTAIATAQQQTPTPVAAPPPNPVIVPSTPQPGIPVGASGRSAFPEARRGIGRQPGGTDLTPFPVIVPPNTHPVYPEAFDPLLVLDVLELQAATTAAEPLPTYGAAQGRPGGGLGVTITGGNTNPPPAPSVEVPATTDLPAATNIVVPTAPRSTPLPIPAPQYQ